MDSNETFTAMTRALQADGAATASGPSSHDNRHLLGQILNVSRLATIGEMAAGIAHELNQPLTAIANYSQACERLLDQPPVDTGALRMALGEITQEAVRASQIISRLRALARSHEVARAPTDVNTMIEEVMVLAGADARARNIRLVKDLAVGLPPATLDSLQIQHVLLNLMRNAAEAMTDATTTDRSITIHSGVSPEGNLELTVCDTGPGVTEDLRTLLFDPFFSTKQGGTGLGLPISKSIVRAHGGSLGYRNNQPQGACFLIHIPFQAGT